MKKYRVEIHAHGDNIMEVWASDREEAKELALEEFAELLVEYSAEILEIDGEKEE